MELTKKHFDEQLSKLVATIDSRFETQTQILMTHADEQVEMLARMVQKGFEDLQERIDVRERVTQLEEEMKRMKKVLHV